MNSCCCFSLHTGGLIIGVLEIIGGVIGALLCILSLGVWSVVKGELSTVDYHNLTQTLAKSDDNTEFKNLDSETLQKQVEVGLIFVNIIVVIFLIISCFQIVISSILVHGIRKKSSSLITVWMVFKVIFIILLVIIFVASFFHGITFQEIIIYLALLGLSAFYVKVVFELRNQHLNEADGLPNYTLSHNKL